MSIWITKKYTQNKYWNPDEHSWNGQCAGAVDGAVDGETLVLPDTEREYDTHTHR